MWHLFNMFLDAKALSFLLIPVIALFRSASKNTLLEMFVIYV